MKDTHQEEQRFKELQRQAALLGVSVITMLLTRSSLYWQATINRAELTEFTVTATALGYGYIKQTVNIS